MIASFHDFLARNEGRIERVLHWTMILALAVLTAFSAATNIPLLAFQTETLDEEAAKVVLGGLIFFVNIASFLAIFWITRGNRRRKPTGRSGQSSAISNQGTAP